MNMRPEYVETAVLDSLRHNFCVGGLTSSSLSARAQSQKLNDGGALDVKIDSLSFLKYPWESLHKHKIESCPSARGLVKVEGPGSGSNPVEMRGLSPTPRNVSPWAGVLGIPELRRLNDAYKTDLCRKYAGRDGMEIVGQDMLTVESLTSRISNVENCCKACTENSLVCKSFTVKNNLCYLKTASRATAMRRSKDRGVISAWRDTDEDPLGNNID